MRKTNGFILFSPYRPRDFYEVERSALRRIDELRVEIRQVKNSKELNISEKLIELVELNRLLNIQRELVKKTRENADRFNCSYHSNHK